MPENKGYLTADRSSNGDERYTPRYAVTPLLEFTPPPIEPSSDLVSI